MLSISEAVDLAKGHYQFGRPQSAEQLCRQILEREPQHVDALFLLGLLAFQGGNRSEAGHYYFSVRYYAGDQITRRRIIIWQQRCARNVNLMRPNRDQYTSL